MSDVDKPPDVMLWLDMAKKKAQKYMDAEWEDMREAFKLMQSQSLQIKDIIGGIERNRKFMEDARNSIDRVTVVCDKLLTKVEELNTILEELKGKKQPNR